MSRIYLSSPHIGDDERALVVDAFDSNWIAPLGPHVDAFEREVAEMTGVGHAAALSSGTAALHLALKLLGVGPGDDVLCSTLTFCASANPVVYLGARPVFVDSAPNSFNVDPDLVEQELGARQREGRAMPKAFIGVDLYGEPADWDRLEAACAAHGVPVIEDAAEALGARYRGRPAGSFGRFGIFSFNGNKIITTSGGGMLVSNDGAAVDKARFLATQARDPAPHYQHSEIGYNYRLSNVCAAIGRGQLRVLEDRVRARQQVYERYVEALSQVQGFSFLEQPAWAEGNRWLTVVLIDTATAPLSPDAVRLALAADDIEARPVWKPMHQQPVFADAPCVGGANADRLFAQGLCLPSGSNLTEAEQGRVIDAILGAVAKAA